MSAPVTLNGRLVADPEFRFTQSGKPFTRFTVATSRRRKNQAGEWEDYDTTFWPCTAWDQTAEQVAETLARGAAVLVVGHAYQNNWEKDGEKRSRIEVRVEAVGPNLRWPAKPADRSAAGQGSDPWANGGAPSEPPF